MKTLLVTGGAGFIGSNFINGILVHNKEVQIINLDALTYAGNMENMEEFLSHTRHQWIHGDIRDKSIVELIFQENEIDAVVHFAAETHVDRSIEGPEVFVSTNVMGTQILLESALNSWKKAKDMKNKRFVQISTDEVYGALGETGLFTECSSIDPSSPYAASKAGADLLVQSYYKTYGLPVNITRCSNNYGPNQHKEKFIPMIIQKALRDEKAPIYGNGLQIRDWIHVEDHCAGIEAVLNGARPGEIYNIGASCERTNLDVAKEILQILGKSITLLKHVPDRLGHDRRYAIDNRKLMNELDWKPNRKFDESLRETVSWYQYKLENR
ncbi:dTDP-glucose 4,6-dehydratase [Alkalibacter rhizosphaerae]|uniref:dTDP-glucose 4,6-dehydratase n=1 Tax=Alkalibacter rhizosphaerae TaxID=2815577 RepID=A0A974XIC1_9FIRM|nr:dTDP-glucose 4,6-dehydratase [Alkalibacter rhizosphaerae]QSX09285.1 dTDP-glucose 4,6-dehydratase [Alkalibacter rhizosphaerae]